MRKLWRYALAFALLVVAFAIRAPFLAREVWNLDEASTFTMAQRVTEGGVLYRDAADNRTPLVPYLKAAIFAVAGDWNATAVHVFVALALGAAAIGLWQICRRLGDERTGIAAAVLFLTLSFTLIGVHESQAAHTEWFQIFFSVPAFLLFARASTQPGFVRGVAIGALFGGAALSKQPGLLDFGVTLVIAAIAGFAADSTTRRGWGSLVLGETAGLAGVFALTFAYFLVNDALEDFVMYAWTYNTRLYVPEVPLLERWSYGRMSFLFTWALSPPLLALALAGAAALAWRAFRSLSLTRTAEPRAVPVLAWLVLGWSASGIASTMLSGRSFSHYAIATIPGLSLAAGWMLVRSAEWVLRRGWLVRVVAALLALATLGAAGVQVNKQLAEITTVDDFPADDRAAIQQLVGPEERIFVWGYLPEIHYYSRRLPSTRFLYGVFLTGMIPWTNLNPEIDTGYAVVPGAWDNFWRDFRRSPPRLIVDTGGQRGWGKYPLQSQPELWQEIQRNYVRVRRSGPRDWDYHYYLRLDAGAAVSGVQPARVTREDPALKPQLSLSTGRPLYTETSIDLPPGTTAVRLLDPPEAPRSLTLPAGRPLPKDSRVCFLLTEEHAHRVAQVEVTTASSILTGPPTDLAAEFRRLRTELLVGLPLKFAGREFPLIDVGALGGKLVRLEKEGGWLAHAPSFVVYRRLPAMSQLILEYAMRRESWADKSHDPTTGADLEVEFQPDGGSARRIFLRHIHPFGVAGDQGKLRSVVPLPGREPGRITLRFQPGVYFDTSFDWTYWTSIAAVADGPVLAYGANYLPPREYVSGSEKMVPLGDERWLAHAPSHATYDFPTGIRELRFGFGLPDEAFAPGQAGRTDGITARVTAELGDGTREVLYERTIDPANRHDHRGTQQAVVPIPWRPYRRLTLELDPGPKQNNAFDWSYLERVSAVGYGPSIELGSGHFLAAESTDVNHDGPMIVDTVHGTFGAHAPSELVYRRPAKLAAVTFHYGLFEASYFDEQGKPRTDGVEVVVDFTSDLGRSTELFRRELTPATRVADRGRQEMRLALPPEEAGRLRFRITPGPSGSNAFDWAYFVDFNGELAP